MQRILLTALVAITTVSAAPDVGACGDKLVPIGGGVRFERVRSTRYPGNIILYVNPGSQLRNAEDALGLGAALERVGHKVRAVHDLDELNAALQDAKPDLVLMDWRDAKQLRTEVQRNGASPSVLRVTYKAGSSEVAEMGTSRDCVADASKRNGLYVVSTVEGVLGRRVTGKPAECDAQLTF